jgi:hypothetical protein
MRVFFIPMNRATSLFVVALFAAVVLPDQLAAQSTNVRPLNTNQNTRGKSGIFRGSGNLIRSNATSSFIGGGQSNIITTNATNAVIGGGFGNVVSNQFGTVGGGVYNLASGNSATLGGGYFNKASNDYATVGGGIGNTASGYSATVGGGNLNTASGDYTTVSGGYTNTASGSWATIAGGEQNTASGTYPTVGGGRENRATDFSTVVAGGYTNTASKPGATVSGGAANTASGETATVGGGYNNTAAGFGATVSGGRTNTASGNFSCVPGGAFATASHTGSFVYNGDDSEPTASFGDGTFTVRCEGGARFYTANGGVGAQLLAGASSWGAPSDSNLKTKVTAVDPRRILAKIAAMPVTEWEYKVVPDRRYIGPTAQDFHAAFGLGFDDKTITTLDSDGVMYAAIQGLVEELKDRDAKIGELEASGAELKAKMDAMEERLNSLPPAR